MAPKFLLLGFFVSLLCSQNQAQQETPSSSLLPNSTLLGNSPFLLSPKGNFFFGLISPSPSKWYLGVSYHIVDKRNIWIANRNASAGDNPGVNFTADGNLVLYASNGTVMWTSGTANRGVTSLRLEDSGNLALLNSTNGTVWQSFEHPSDTWMPGMKMRMGYRLISWRSDIDPAPGRYTMTLLPTSEYVSYWDNDPKYQYWTSGVWNGQIFTNVPQMTANFIYNFTFVNESSTETYFTWSEKYGNGSHFTLKNDGTIRVSILVASGWQNIFTEPESVCQVKRLCGAFGICSISATPSCICPTGFQPARPQEWNNSDWSAGCVPVTKPGCDSRGNSFLPLQSVTYGEIANATTLPDANRRSCEEACAKDCSCVGYSFVDSCSLKYGDLFNGQSDPNSFQLKVVAGVTAATADDKKSTTGRTIIIVLVCVLVPLLGIGVCLVVRRRRRPKRSAGVVLTAFSYKELQKATKNFSEKLGQGGFGAVFKGILPGSANQMVAVKRLDNVSQGEKEFLAEVRTLGTIQHINLVRLWGFCADGSHRLLVYDYMDRGSLDKLLFSGTSQHLDWNARYNIALGTARALAYLHEECRDRIIHCDIKPENILLDADFCPKVSDFGLAKLLGRDMSRVITQMRGTRGYLAPEWISNQPITPKADVFSYGMTLLEIVGGRRNTSVNESLDNWYFPLVAFQHLVSRRIEEIPDKRLDNNFDVAQVERLVKVGMWCIQDEDESRPTMSTAVKMLEGTVDVPTPKLPSSLKMMDTGPEILTAADSSLERGSKFSDGR